MSVSGCTRGNGISVNFSPIGSSFCRQTPLVRLRQAIMNLSLLSSRYRGCGGFGFRLHRHFSIRYASLWRRTLGSSWQANLIKDLSSEFGPLVLGMAIESLGGCSILERRNSQELLKDCLRKTCLHTQAEIGQWILSGFQQELFDIANNSTTVPSICSWKAQVMRQACIDYQRGVRTTAPSIFIQTEAGLVETLNWEKLAYRLSRIHVQGLSSGLCPSEPLGSEKAQIVLELMKLGLSSPLARRLLCRSSSCSATFLSEEALLQFILLGMLYLRKVPTDIRGRLPRKAYARLYRLSHFLRRQVCPYLEPGYIPLTGTWEHPIRYNCQVGVDGISVEQQRILVGTCERVDRVFCSLMR